MTSTNSRFSTLVLHALALTSLTVMVTPVHAQQLRVDSTSAKYTLRDKATPEPGCASWFLSPAHATLLPDGDVLLVGLRRMDEVEPSGSACGDWSCGGFVARLTPSLTHPGTTVELTTMSPPLEYDTGTITCPDPMATCGTTTVFDTLFCGGHTLLKNGSVFFAGGTRSIDENGVFTRTGLPYALVYETLSDTWPSIPPISFVGSGGWDSTCGISCGGTSYIDGPERWYPTATKRANGSVLVTGITQVISYQGSGLQGNPHSTCGSGRNLSIERFNSSGTATVEVSKHSTTPDDIWSAEYAHVFQLPEPIERTGKTFDLLFFGETGQPLLLDDSGALPVSSSAWLAPHSPRPTGTPITTPNDGASSVMLPIFNPHPSSYRRGSVLIAGGDLDGGGGLYSVYDPTLAASGGWLAQGAGALDSPRHHPSTVVLPTGEILIIAGHNGGFTEGDVAEFVDPRTGFTHSSGTASLAGGIRGYHTATVLLPDGRVFVGGGRQQATFEKASFEYYSPPYWNENTPLSFVSAPQSIEYGEDFGVSLETGPRKPVMELALLSLGSMTHSFDMNQRYIELELVIQAGGGPLGNYVAVAKAPANGRIAPPGYYMLFAVDRSLNPAEPTICAEAAIVHLQ